MRMMPNTFHFAATGLAPVLMSLALAACSTTGRDAPVPDGSDDAPGQCRASAYESYVGRNRSELPAKPAGETWRVTCSTCPVTLDYNPSRLNIIFDSATGVIREVKCG